MGCLFRLRPPGPFPSEPAEPSRRPFLRALGTLIGGACLGGLAGALSCAPGEETDAGPSPTPAETRLHLASLPPGERLRVLHDGRPVEVRRVGEEVVARSLICTHFACEVRWKADEEVYACPCHDGRFGPDGRVLGGPPSRPLPEVPVRVAGGLVVLGG